MTRIERWTQNDVMTMIDWSSLSFQERVAFASNVTAATKLFVGFVDGKLVAIWGLCPPSLLDNTAYLWLHVTEAMSKHEFVLVRQSQKQVKAMLDEFGSIYGLTAKDNIKAVRWLEWLGAKFAPPNDFGLRRFTIQRRADG